MHIHLHMHTHLPSIVDYQCHLQSRCTEGLLPQPDPSSSSDCVEEMLAKSPETPLTSLEQQLTSRLVRRQLSSDSGGGGMLKIKTGGQVQYTWS